MRKILITIFTVLLLNGVAFAQTPLEFIYINGSNNNNTTMKNWFFNGIKNLHPVIKKKIEKNADTQKWFLEDGKYSIEEQPVIFFWGDKSKADLEFMTNRAQMMKGVSHLFAYFTRLLIAECFHDAIWVQKTHNMIPIVEDLNKQVLNSNKNGKKVVLFGYSAGSFITYQYLLAKIPYLELDKYFELHPVDSKTMEYIKKNPRKNTCLMAFADSKVAVASPLGTVLPNTNSEEFLKGYKDLDKFTEKACIPDDVVYGVVNFASPIPLFYSDMADANWEPNIYNKWLFKYIYEHDMFWLTVNYADDPMGFPNGVNNLSNKEIEEYITLKLAERKGFMYDYSKYSSWTSFMFAHTSYWVTKRRFATAIVKGYSEGYKYKFELVQNKKTKNKK